MGVIIGAGTTFIGSPIFDNACVNSIQWGYEPQTERLWCVGSWSPYAVLRQAQQTLSVSVYGKNAEGNGGTGELILSPSTTCEDSTAAVHITLVPASCDVSLATKPINNEKFFITSYGFSKEALGYGTETWQMMRYISSAEDPNINVPSPTYILQGIADGNRSGPADHGIVMEVDSSGYTGQVSAGQPGIGEANMTEYGIVSRVGGSQGWDPGKFGSAQANIPHNPIYI